MSTTKTVMATVVGIEIHYPGVALSCDVCGTCYDGGNGTTKEEPYRIAGYRRYEIDLLRSDARSIGWTGPMTEESTTDKCPTCSKASETTITE